MLHIITGPMFSGKTTYLSKILNNSSNSIYINHSYDTRGDFFYSHNLSLKLNVKCIKTSLLTDDLIDKYDIICIDEFQFFKDSKETILRWVETMNKVVYVTGLSCDYKRETFGDLIDLVRFCDTITKLSSVCSCGREAIFSRRLIQSEEKIVIGSSEYEPVCRKCYKQ
jgi:thymidine kinase